MLKIYLVRPGSTEYDQQGRIQGTLDIPLCEDGRRQVDAVRQQLQEERPEAIYASPSQSAEQTAEALAVELDRHPKTLDKLHNLDHGLWQGMRMKDVKAKQPKVYRQWQEQPETVCPPQGETVTAAKARVASVLRKLLKKHKADSSILLVTPEPLASVIRHVLRQDVLNELWKPSNNCGTWEAIEVSDSLLDAS